MKQIKFLLVLLLVVSLSVIVGCSKPKYVVSFDTDCEQSIASQEVVENEKAVKPEDPVKEGHEFLGWYNGEVEYKFDEAVIANIALKAKWEICVYTVSFETGTEETIDSQSIKYNKKASQPEDPSKEGYTFGGWYNGDVKYNFDDAVKGDVTLVAKWDEIPTFTVKFIAEGEVVEELTVQQGKDAKAPNAPTIEGKTFVKWEGVYTNVTENSEVVAVYEVNVYTVEFKVDGVLYGSAIQVEHGKGVEAPVDPSKEGFEFTGWDKEFSEVKGNLVVNATFKALSYTIKYYSGTTEISNLEPATYTPSDTITLTAYEVSGYYFYGWYDNADYTGNPITEIKAGTTGNKTFYALNVKVDANGGKDCWTTEIPSGHDLGTGIDAISNLPETFEMDFFKYLSDNNLLTDSRVAASVQATTWEVFSGENTVHKTSSGSGDPQRVWNDTSTNVASGADGYMALFLYETIELNGDLTVKNIEGGFLGSEPYKSKYQGLINLLVILSNSKYGAVQSTAKSKALLAFVLDGYFYGTQGIGSGVFAAARSVIPGTTFGYKANGDAVEKVEYEVNALPTPVKDGYVFAGWYLDKAGTKLVGSAKATNLCTLYAKWEQIK